jgi:toxin ParE1/3/4
VIKITYSDVATHDLKSIFNYINRDSNRFAKLEVSKIRTFIKSLTMFPLKGKYYEIVKGREIRVVVFRNYIIFYTNTENQILILTIHHHARLISNNPAFKDDE